MKLRSAIFSISFLILTQIIISCDENIQVLANPEFIPVVYCLLNPENSVQTVRVSRVFQDRNQLSDWEHKYDAWLADSSKLVYLEHFGDLGEHSIWNFRMDKQIRQVDDSVFALTYLYTTPFRPSFSTTYQLYAYFPDTKTMVSSKITTLTYVELYDPATVLGRKIVIGPTQPFVMRWSGSPGTAYY